MKKLLIFLVAPFLLWGCEENISNTDNNPETIKIGGIAPLSGDGATVGLMIQNVTNLAIETINNDGGINGKNIEILWEDGKCNPGDSSRSTQKLVNIDKVTAILGGVCSGETLGAAPITEKKKVILLSSASSSPEITSAGDFVFRTSPSDNSQGSILADYANKNFKKVGMITEQTDYSIGIASTFKEHFTGEIVEENYLPTESDFKTRITKLKNENIEGVLLIPQSPAKFEILIRQLQEQNWDKPILSNEIVTNTEVLKKFSDFFVKVSYVGAQFIVPDSENLNTFIDSYTTKFGEVPIYTNYVATTIDAVNMLAKALKEVESNDTEKIRDALYNIQNYEGFSGNISFDKNGDINITHSLFSFDGEKLVSLDEK
ncbi:ABC transporter substrate-binding protein [Candidatus Gracilibacteria bacterium]|nr:ABC transporter substrate-binding protein [Candidatus Gracilibacteria bacterium]